MTRIIVSSNMDKEFYQLYPNQSLIFNHAISNPETVVATGRQWGKTLLCKWLAIHIIQKMEYGDHLLYISPNNHMSFNIWKGLLDELVEGKYPLSQSVYTPDRLRGWLHTENNGILRMISAGMDFKGIDKPKYVIVDEAAYIPSYIYSLIKSWSRESDYIGTLFISTPTSKGTYFYEYWNKTQEHFQFPSPMNSDSLRSGMDQRMVESEIEGKFVDEEGKPLESKRGLSYRDNLL